MSVNVAMYSSTDRELAAELVRLARSGVRVRVYRDSRESMHENQRGTSTTATLLAGGVDEVAFQVCLQQYHHHRAVFAERVALDPEYGLQLEILPPRNSRP